MLVIKRRLISRSYLVNSAFYRAGQKARSLGDVRSALELKRQYPCPVLRTHGSEAASASSLQLRSMNLTGEAARQSQPASSERKQHGPSPQRRRRYQPSQPPPAAPSQTPARASHLFQSAIQSATGIHKESSFPARRPT